jgi:carbamoyl-phosphate synthase small subunit
MRVGIFSGTDLTREEMVIKVRKSPSMSGAHLVEDVTTPEIYQIPAADLGREKVKVVAIDLGIKGATPRLLSEIGIDVSIVPSSVSLEEIKALGADGVFLSNGPGDPSTMDNTVELIRSLLWEKMPIFGICFGHQLIGRALGFDTYKLPFGHRGINQPVKNIKSGKVEITAHNHGFAVDAPTNGNFRTVYGEGYVSHINLNDGVVEGLKLIDLPVFSVQYHPESAAGPHDSRYLFEEFYQAILKSKLEKENHA